MKTVIVTGIPGTGKSTVCNLFREMSEKEGTPATIINYGTVTQELLRANGQTVHRDEMRKSTMDSQRLFQKKAAEAISRKIENLSGIVVIDTHMAIRTPQGYMPGLPRHVLEVLQPELFVLIEANQDEISTRRSKDTVRRRDDSNEETVKEELQISRLMAGACAVLTGAPVKMVINANGRQEEAARELMRITGVADNV